MDRLRITTRLIGAFMFWAACAGTSWCSTGVPVLQRGYDANVTGANLGETTLTPTNVSPSTFGRVFSLPIDGGMYAQPLYVPNVTIPGKGLHNVLYIATTTASIYAFDADAPAAPLWTVNYVPKQGAVLSNGILLNTDWANEPGPIGIEATPVIDPATNIMYFVAATYESAGTVFRLHAVDITTGNELNGGPMVISGSVTVGGTKLAFTPFVQNQRVGLVIAKNQIIIAFASHGDVYNYTGWMMSYNKTTLAQTGIFATQPTSGFGAGIWQSGRPPAVDSAGDVYAFTGNAYGGTWDGVNNFSETALKLDPGNGLALLDYFTPANYSYLDSGDIDLSASGPLMIPGTTDLVVSGKDGGFYLVNNLKMGHEQPNNAGTLQSFQETNGRNYTGPAYWARSTAGGGPLLFYWSIYDTLKSFAFNGATFNTTPTAQYTAGPNNYPGGALTVSSNGDTQGVLWALIAIGAGNGGGQVMAGSLMAFNAANVSQALWSSTTSAARDDFGLYAKWAPPMVTNGKVYVPTNSSQVVVYGLLPITGTVTVWPAVEPTLGGTASFVVRSLAKSGSVQSASWNVAGLPLGANGSFSTDGQNQVVLQVTTSSATPPGNYTLTVTATAGSSSPVSQTAVLKVVPSYSITATSASADSTQSGYPASAVIDANPATFWQTASSPSVASYPHTITLDLGSVQPLVGLSYLPRQDGCANGTQLQYTVFASNDGAHFKDVTGTSFAYGPDALSFNCNNNSFFLPKQQNIVFPQQVAARYVQLQGFLGDILGLQYDSAAELRAYSAKPPSGSVSGLPSNVVACAVDGQTCILPAGVITTVYYGAGSTWDVIPNVSNSFTCWFANLGVADPLPGVQKSCQTVAGWVAGEPYGAVLCAVDGYTCALPAGMNATIYYGVVGGGVWLKVPGVFTGSFTCAPGNGMNVPDPDFGTQKTCFYLQNSVTSVPSNAVSCAAEHGTCSIPIGSVATLYYGANTTWDVIPGVNGGSYSCETANLSVADPNYGVVKSCRYVATPITAPPSGATSCAVDFGTCTLPQGTAATIYYGANKNWAVISARIGSFTCLPASLNVADPYPNVQKTCYYVKE